MNAAFWHERWEKNQTPFHEGTTNTYLAAYFDQLALSQGSRVFVPLCGKTRDIAWVLSKGYRVAGAELSELAIQQLFDELGVEPDVSEVGNLKHYHAPDIDIFVGDIFEVTADLLGAVDAIYDRAALVALPEQVRVDYANHLTSITNTPPQLLITYEYERDLMTGPPFSISDEEIQRHYGSTYKISLLRSGDVVGGLRGLSGPQEKVWLLQPTT